jgi:hypothetical protein
LACSDRGDIWDAFDGAVERAETALKRVRENYEIVEQTGKPLPEVYGTALAGLQEATQAFDSVYEVTEAELEQAETVVARAEFLVAVTAAHREYHETIIDRRVAVTEEWFDVLDAGTSDAELDVAADRSTLARQVKAIQKLTDAGKYGQLQSSDRVNLDEVEGEVHDFHDAARDAVSATEYVRLGLEVAESFHGLYTDDLSALVREGVDKEAISIADDIQNAPEMDPIAARFESDDVTDDDANAVGTIVKTYARVAQLTGTHRARYELGASLLSAIQDNDLVDDTGDIVADLHFRLTSIETGPIEQRVAEIVEGEATTSETERLRQLLAEHNGSVRRTLQVVDRSPETVFEQLQALLEDGTIDDLEVRFE